MTRAQKFPLFLLTLLLLACASARATEVRLFTISGGGGRTDGATQRALLTVGQNAIGKVGPGSGTTGTGLGFWEIVGHPYVVSGVGDETPVVRTRLRDNYPNPFNPSTRIGFDLVAPAAVRIELYDLRGHRVDTLLDAVKPAGSHSLTYQPDGLASGAYVVLMRAGSFRATQRIMLVK